MSSLQNKNCDKMSPFLLMRQIDVIIFVAFLRHRCANSEIMRSAGCQTFHTQAVHLLWFAPGRFTFCLMLQTSRAQKVDLDLLLVQVRMVECCNLNQALWDLTGRPGFQCNCVQHCSNRNMQPEPGPTAWPPPLGYLHSTVTDQILTGLAIMNIHTDMESDSIYYIPESIRMIR